LARTTWDKAAQTTKAYPAQSNSAFGGPPQLAVFLFVPIMSQFVSLILALSVIRGAAPSWSLLDKSGHWSSFSSRWFVG
jgi:hypothetical protein